MLNYITSKLKIALVSLLAVGLVAGCGGGGGGGGGGASAAAVAKGPTCPWHIELTVQDLMSEEKATEFAASTISIAYHLAFSDVNLEDLQLTDEGTMTLSGQGYDFYYICI